MSDQPVFQTPPPAKKPGSLFVAHVPGSWIRDSSNYFAMEREIVDGKMTDWVFVYWRHAEGVPNRTHHIEPNIKFEKCDDGEGFFVIIDGNRDSWYADASDAAHHVIAYKKGWKDRENQR